MEVSFSKIAARIAKNAWYRKSFEGTVYSLNQWQVVSHAQKKDPFFSVRFHESLTITHGNRVEWFWNQSDLLVLREWFIQNIRKDGSFATKLINRWEQEIKKTRKLLSRLETLNLKRCSDNELAREYESFFTQTIKGNALSVLNEGFSLSAEVWLKELLHAFLKKKGMSEKISEYFSVLTRATRPSFIQEAQIAKKRGMPPQALAKKYFWIHFNYLYTQPLSPRFFRTMPVGEIPNVSKLKKVKKTLMNQLQLPKGLCNLFEAVDLFTWWQDQRKKYALLATFWQYQFLKEAGRRAKLPNEVLFRILPSEFALLAKRDARFLERLLKRRDPLLVYVRDDGVEHIFSGKAVESLLARLTYQKERRILSGTPTYRGIVRGRVVVLLSISDMKRVRQGDILVSSMTRPEYTPIIKKAGAIITDEGGIASHASIISREFKTPCIIGTKIATKIFKDSDMVEVDANNGIVTLLSSPYA